MENLKKWNEFCDSKSISDCKRYFNEIAPAITNANRRMNRLDAKMKKVKKKFLMLSLIAVIFALIEVFVIYGGFEDFQNRASEFITIITLAIPGALIFIRFFILGLMWSILRNIIPALALKRITDEAKKLEASLDTQITYAKNNFNENYVSNLNTSRENIVDSIILSEYKMTGKNVKYAIGTDSKVRTSAFTSTALVCQAEELLFCQEVVNFMDNNNYKNINTVAININDIVSMDITNLDEENERDFGKDYEDFIGLINHDKYKFISATINVVGGTSISLEANDNTGNITRSLNGINELIKSNKRAKNDMLKNIVDTVSAK